MKVSVISVLYNQKPTAGNTWRTLLGPALEGKKAEAVLADNSTDPAVREENRKTAEYFGAAYLDMQGNQGLPKAYNRAIQYILDKTGDIGSAEVPGTGTQKGGDWIVVTDQDTCFPEEYLTVLEETAAAICRDGAECGVLFPEVYAGEKQLSPCRRKKDRFVPFSPGKTGTEGSRRNELQEAFFINTGLAFRKSLFEDPEIRYDERLFLDFADFDLINRIRARSQVRFGQLPGVRLEQQFSGTETRTKEQDLERFRHFAGDGRLFYERWYGTGAAESAVRRRAVRLALKYRDIQFLKKN